MNTTIKSDAVVDLSATAGSVWSMKAPFAGYVDLESAFLRFEEAVASGGFSSTASVVSIEVGGSEVATWTTGVGATAVAIGDTKTFTLDSSVDANVGSVKVAAGDLIDFKLKTLGTGGTLTGTARLHINCDFNY